MGVVIMNRNLKDWWSEKPFGEKSSLIIFAVVFGGIIFATTGFVLIQVVSSQI